jgi:hypothetical protein
LFLDVNVYPGNLLALRPGSARLQSRQQQTISCFRTRRETPDREVTRYLQVLLNGMDVYTCVHQSTNQSHAMNKSRINIKQMLPLSYFDPHNASRTRQGIMRLSNSTSGSTFNLAVESTPHTLSSFETIQSWLSRLVGVYLY